MATCKFLLVTRFNIPIQTWQTDKSGQVILDEPWMKHRMDLFKTFCLPSVSGQSDTDFEWLLYCDRNTHPTDLNQLRSLLRQIPQAQVRLIRDFEELLPDLRHYAQSIPTDYIITTRLDNDDGIGKDFVRIVKNAMPFRDGVLINLLGGIVYDVELKVLTEISEGRLNHYSSLVEQNAPGKDLITVLGFAHQKPPEHLEIVNIPCRFAWLKVIHARNMMSQLKGMPIFNQSVGIHFNVNISRLNISYINTLKYVALRLKSKLFGNP